MAPRKNSDKSEVWNFFVRKDCETVTCRVCRKDIKYLGSTSNMKAHLRCKNHSSLTSETTDDLCDLSFANTPSTSFSVASSEVVTTTKRPYEEVVHYDKLVVPTSMRSVYWKCYGFPASEDGKILTKAKTVCILCKKVTNYKQNTTNLRTHLRSRHPKELAVLEKSAVTKNTEPVRQEKNVLWKKRSDDSTEGYGTNLDGESADMGIEYESNVKQSTSVKAEMSLVMTEDTQECSIDALHPYLLPMETKTLGDMILEFIILDMQLPDVVEGQGFQRLLAYMKSPCEIPSKSKLVEDLIPQVYQTFKETVLHTLNTIKTNITLCVEEWESTNGDAFITFSVSYIQDKTQIVVNNVLSTIHCRYFIDNSFWETALDKIMDDWNLTFDRIKTVVCATNREVLLNVFLQKGLIIVPCFIHTLQELCTRVCYNQEDMLSVLRKFRIIIYLLHSNHNALTALRMQDHLMSLDESPLVSDNPKLWLSTYSMLENMVARRQVLRTIIENLETSDVDKETIYISDQEWALVDDVITVLEPFQVTMLTLSEEASPFVSLVKPLLCQLLNSHLKSKDEDSINVQIFKSSLKTLLSQKFDDAALNHLLNIGTTLDPRFKALPSIAQEAKICLEGPIKKRLIELIAQDPVGVEPISGVVPEKKKSKLGMVIMLGDMCPSPQLSESMTCEERANLELVQYKSEPSAMLDQCPMTWWNHNSSKCPNLARLATEIIPTPATAMPPGRVSLEAQIAFESKRANLAPEIIDKILFLNSNHT